EHIVLAGFDDHTMHLRMFEAQPLDGVVELDVDTEIVGIELELVAVGEAAGRIDIHNEIGDVAVLLDAPVAVARWLGLEVDGGHGLASTLGPALKPALMPLSPYALLCI